MSLDPPPFLASLQNNIRQRPIPWDGAVRTGVLTEDQLKRIRAIDKAKQDARRQTVEADLDGYCALFVGEPGKPSVLESSNKQSNYHVVRYILVLLSDLLDTIPSLSKALFKHSDPYRHFLPLLAQTSGPDDTIPIPLLTSTVLAALAASTRDESPATIQKALPVILSYLSTLTKNSDAGLQDIGVQQYSLLLYSSKSRMQFWSQRSETVAPLIDILRAAAGSSNGDSSNLRGSSLRGSAAIEGSIGGGVGIQLLYHVLLVLWQLSFEAEEVGCDLEEYVCLCFPSPSPSYPIRTPPHWRCSSRRTLGLPCPVIYLLLQGVQHHLALHPAPKALAQGEDDAPPSVDAV